MANKIQFANASEIFTLRKQGVIVPPNVLAAARRTLAGQATPADASVIRNYIGIQHSGAKELKRSVSQVRALQQGVGDIEVAAEMYENAAKNGSNPFPSGARLVQVITDKTQDFLKTKLVKNLAVSVGKVLGSDARASKALLLGLRRAASLGGAAVAAVGLGIDIGSRVGLGLFDATAKRNASAGFSFDVARRNGMNIADFALQSRGIRQDVVTNRSLYEKVRDALGFDQDTTEEQERRINLRADNMKRARPFTGRYGANPEAMLVEVARRKGKTVSELTDREVNEALDHANRFLTDPSYYINKIDETESNTEMEEPNDDVDKRLRNKLYLKTPAYQRWFWSLDPARRRKEWEKIAEEDVIPEAIKGEEIRAADKRIAAENTREALFNTPEKKAAFRELLAITQANYQAEYARHKVVEYD